MNKILIADNVSKAVSEVFDKNDILYDTKVGLSEEELASEIIDYTGLIVRSAVTVTEKIINNAENLKVIGRPGVGVDNVDLNAATAKGIVVMNTPLGNVQATAELTFGIIHSLMRKLNVANHSMHENKWEKKKFIGNEMLGKTIGIIGFGGKSGFIGRGGGSIGFTKRGLLISGTGRFGTILGGVGLDTLPPPPPPPLPIGRSTSGSYPKGFSPLVLPKLSS